MVHYVLARIEPATCTVADPPNGETHYAHAVLRRSDASFPLQPGLTRACCIRGVVRSRSFKTRAIMVMYFPRRSRNDARGITSTAFFGHPCIV